MKFLVIGKEKEEALQFARDLANNLGLPLCEDTRVSSRSVNNLDDNTIYFAPGVTYSTARAWFFDVIISYKPSSVYTKALASAKHVRLYKLVNLDGEIVYHGSQPCNALTQSGAYILRNKIFEATGEVANIALDHDSMAAVNKNKSI